MYEYTFVWKLFYFPLVFILVRCVAGPDLEVRQVSVQKELLSLALLKHNLPCILFLFIFVFILDSFSMICTHGHTGVVTDIQLLVLTSTCLCMYMCAMRLLK